MPVDIPITIKINEKKGDNMTKEEELIELWKLVYELEHFECYVKRLCREDRIGIISNKTVEQVHDLRDTLIAFVHCTSPDVGWEEEKAWIEEVLPDVKQGLASYLDSLTEEEYLIMLEDDQNDAEWSCGQWEDMTKRITQVMQSK